MLTPERGQRTSAIGAVEGGESMPQKEGRNKPRRVRRRITRFALALFVFTAIIVVFLPNILNVTGISTSVVRNALAKKVDGIADVDRVQLRWFGGQTIDGVRITGNDGASAIELSVTLERDLLPLLRGTSDYGTVRIRGSIEGVRREDGSLNLTDLIKSRAAPAKEPTSSGPPAMRINVVIEELDVLVHDRPSGSNLTLDNLTGRIDLDLPRATTIDLSATTRSGETRGSMHITGGVANLFTPDGALNIQGAEIDEIEATLASVPLTLIDGLLGMNGRLSSITGDTVDNATITLDGSPQRAQGKIDINARAFQMQAALLIEDGMLIVTPETPVVVRAEVRDEILEAWLRADRTDIAAAYHRRVQEYFSERVRESGNTWRIQPVRQGIDPAEPPPPPARDRIRIAPNDNGQPGFAELTITEARIPLPGPDGTIDLRGASITATVTGGDVMLIMPGRRHGESINIGEIALSCASEDLTQSVQIDVESTATLGGSKDSRFSAHLTHAKPITQGGRLRFDPATLEGEVRGEQLPTSLLDALVENTPIDLRRDIGPRLDFAATFSAGERRDISITARAANLTAMVTSIVTTDGAIMGESLVIETDLRAKLLDQFAPRGGISVPQHLRLDLTSFSLPPIGEEGFDLKNVAFEGTLAFSGEPVLGFGSEGERRNPLVVNPEEFTLASPALDEYVQTTGALTINGAHVEIDERLSSFFDASGSLAPFGILADGRVKVRNVTPELIARWAPDSEELLREALGGPLRVSIVTRADQGDLRADISLASRRLRGSVQMRRSADQVVAEAATINLVLAPALARALQRERAEPIELSADEATITLARPIIVARWIDGAYRPGVDAIEASLTSPALLVNNAPGFDEAIAIENLEANLAAKLGDQPVYSINGTAVLLRDEPRTKIADARYDIALRREDDGGTLTPIANVTLTDIDVNSIEEILAAEKGAYAGFLGDRGDLTIDARPTDDGFRATVTPAFPNLTGVLALEKTPETISFTADDLTMILSREALEKQLNRADDSGEPPAEPAITVRKDVPLKVRITKCVLPAAVLSGEPLDSTAIGLEIHIEPAAQLVLERARPDATDPETIRFRDWSIDIVGDDLNAAIAATLHGVIATFAGEKRTGRGAVDLDVNISNLVNEQSIFSTDAATLDLKANVKRFPVAVAALFVDTRVALTDVLGDSLDATLHSNGFSGNSGTLTTEITTSNKSRLAGSLRGARNGFTIRKNRSIDLDLVLTQALRDDLLAFIHPIFRDISSDGRPISIKLRNAFIPADHDLKRLNAIIELTVGEVTFESGSQFLKVLQFVETSNRDRVPGFIGPLDGSPMQIKIVNGRVLYDDFPVHIGGNRTAYKQKLVFSGDIDLVRPYVNSVGALYPVAALGRSVRELRNMPDFLKVGLRYSGKPDNLKMDIDLQFKPGNIFKDFLEREGEDALIPPELRDLFNEGGGGLFDDLLNPKRERKPKRRNNSGG